MQMAVIEASRNLAGLANAGSEEFDHEAGAKRFTPVVYHLKEWIQGNHVVQRKTGDDKGGTMRLGAYTATLKPGSHVAQIYGTTTIEERHRHRYEVDAKYIESLEKCGLIFSGTVSYTHLDVYKRQAFGIVLVAAIVGALIWVLIDYGILTLQNPSLNLWLGILALSVVLGIGLSWSIIRQRLSGQATVDEVQE